MKVKLSVALHEYPRSVRPLLAFLLLLNRNGRYPPFCAQPTQEAACEIQGLAFLGSSSASAPQLACMSHDAVYMRSQGETCFCNFLILLKYKGLWKGPMEKKRKKMQILEASEQQREQATTKYIGLIYEREIASASFAPKSDINMNGGVALRVVPKGN